MKEKKGMDRACGAVCCHWRAAAVLGSRRGSAVFSCWRSCHRLRGEWLMLCGREKHKACRVLSRVGRVLFALFVLSFAAVQMFVIGVHIRGKRPVRRARRQIYYLTLGCAGQSERTAVGGWRHGAIRQSRC